MYSIHHCSMIIFASIRVVKTSPLSNSSLSLLIWELSETKPKVSQIIQFLDQHIGEEAYRKCPADPKTIRKVLAERKRIQGEDKEETWWRKGRTVS